MNQEKYFAENPELRSYVVQGVEFQIEVNEHVFPPPQESPISAKNISITKGESIIDVGTGSGILAVLAAKLGGKVCATDIDEHAIDVTNINAEKNGVNIESAVGKHFASFERKFDVIIANLAQTIIFEKAKQGMGTLSDSVNGGEDGNKEVLDLLREAKKHMHETSRMYVNVFSISDYKTTINEMIKGYSVRLLAMQSEPVKNFVADDIDQYRKPNEEGKIRIYKDPQTQKWQADQMFFELHLKKD